ncbi:K(+) efflux antiporter 3, chloroplastic-like [Durio zibethinus]|uniref:K(+) efflux antiporter 3, chloroplastic-like n=1 Tax=Durio zibethinus TaxID=66656 RepID=A0A6P6ADC6_DURZI|nr:K(+) efflux antiporter 3, chloroplastic-like [Durio zibethinus]
MPAQESLEGFICFLSGYRTFLGKFLRLLLKTRGSEAFVALWLLMVAGTSLVTQQLGFSDTASRKLVFQILYGDGSSPAVLHSASISSPKAVMIMYRGKKGQLKSFKGFLLPTCKKGELPTRFGSAPLGDTSFTGSLRSKHQKYDVNYLFAPYSLIFAGHSCCPSLSHTSSA